MSQKPRVLLWFGHFEDTIAMANKLQKEFNVVGIVTEKRKGNSVSSMSVKQLSQAVLNKLFTRKIDKAWANMLQFYNGKYPNLPAVEHIEIHNINSLDAYKFSKKLKADLILVYGTRLIKKRLLNLSPSLGIINLHTGLSPYIKGGPNCTNWCLATKQFKYIGNTIMWIDAGIDSGNIIAAELTPLKETQTFNDLHINVLEHAHDLYMRTTRAICNGDTVPNVSQDKLGTGITYYTRMWTFKKRWKAIRNFNILNKEIASGELEISRENIKTIPTS